MDHLRLQIRDLGERGLDALFDDTDLGGQFVGGVFHLLFAHDFSSPEAVIRVPAD
jgi:hypothetical protein